MNRQLRFGAGVLLLLLSLDYEAVSLLAVRGVLQVSLLVSGITPEELLDIFHDTPPHCIYSRAIAAEERKNPEKDAQPEEIKRKMDFSDLRNPQKHFTPLFGEVAKFGTLTEKAEQQSRDGDEVERCLPQNT